MVLFVQFQNDQKPARPHPAKNNLLRDRLSAGWMATQYHFMARTKKMADPYHVSDVLTSITRAFHDAEVSLDSVKVAKAETANIVAKFTLLKKENKELRDQLLRAEEKLKAAEIHRAKHYKNVAAWYQNALVKIQLLSSLEYHESIDADNEVLEAPLPPVYHDLGPMKRRRHDAEDAEDAE